MLRTSRSETDNPKGPKYFCTFFVQILDRFCTEFGQNLQVDFRPWAKPSMRYTGWVVCASDIEDPINKQVVSSGTNKPS